MKHGVRKVLRNRHLGVGDLDRVTHLDRDHVHNHASGLIRQIPETDTNLKSNHIDSTIVSENLRKANDSPPSFHQLDSVRSCLNVRSGMPELVQRETPVDLPLPEVANTAVSSQTNIRSFSLTGLFILAFFYTLYFAADFVLPVALAILMSLLLLPLGD